jgi:hypothetical protein
MPSPQIPRSLIDLLQREGANPEESYRGYRKLGGNISSAIWQRVWGEVENELALGTIERGKPLNQKPTAEDILPMTTKRASGYLQQVSVILTDSEGSAFTRTYSLSTKELMSRARAVRTAMQRLEENMETEGTGSVIEGGEVKLAFYSGTYEMTPR